MRNLGSRVVSRAICAAAVLLGACGGVTSDGTGRAQGEGVGGAAAGAGGASVGGGAGGGAGLAGAASTGGASAGEGGSGGSAVGGAASGGGAGAAGGPALPPSCSVVPDPDGLNLQYCESVFLSMPGANHFVPPFFEVECVAHDDVTSLLLTNLCTEPDSWKMGDPICCATAQIP